MKPTIFIILFSLIISTQAHAWVVSMDAEGGTVGQRPDKSAGWTYSGTDCTFDDSEKLGGKQSFRCRLPKGSHGETARWGFALQLPTHVSLGNEIWYRVWIKLPADYEWSPDRPGNKFMRLHSYQGDGTVKHYINAYSKTSGILVENWVPGVATFYDTLNLASNHSTVVESKPKLGYKSDGTYIGWEAVELYVKMGLAGQGIVRCWRNGILWFEDKLNATAIDSGGFIKTITLFGHYSDTADEAGSPKDQSVWVDDIVVTNQRPSHTDSKGNPFMGVGDVKIVAPPNPPQVQ